MVTWALGYRAQVLQQGKAKVKGYLLAAWVGVPRHEGISITVRNILSASWHEGLRFPCVTAGAIHGKLQRTGAEQDPSSPSLGKVVLTSARRSAVTFQDTCEWKRGSSYDSLMMGTIAE